MRGRQNAARLEDDLLPEGSAPASTGAVDVHSPHHKAPIIGFTDITGSAPIIASGADIVGSGDIIGDITPIIGLRRPQ
jgi:hypothetical protein